MKDYKLISSGANGKLYYAMDSALDELKEIVEFADRVYIIDEGKNYIWTGSQFVEDLNPIAHSDDSGSGGGENLLVTLSFDGEIATFDKTWNEIHSAFPNVYVTDGTNYYSVGSLMVDSSYYYVIIPTFSIAGTMDVTVFEANSENGYPSNGGGPK